MNKVTLYIGGREVELSDDTLILYNYKLEDMSNPTIVENSYSQSVSIQGTPANNEIFGNIWRLDRTTLEYGSGIGPNFDATRKTPFTLEDSTGAQIESGYVKLDGMTVDKDGQVTYKVTLYGGLGSYLYSLQYKENGDKMTLADLQYLEGDESESELTYQINADAVAEAWDNIEPEDDEYTSKWNVVNFAPAYNGIPANNFDADKAMIVPTDHNLSADVTEVKDGVTVHYTPRGNYALVTMDKEHTEWECKDLRSYLQRPILSIGAFLHALTKEVNSNGFEVDIDSIKDLDYAKTWVTLPMLPDLGTFKQSTGEITAVISSEGATESPIAEVSLVGISAISSGTTIKATFALKLRMHVANMSTTDTPLMWRQTKYLDASRTKEISAHCSVGFAQLVAYDEHDNIVGGSNILTVGDLGLSQTPTQCAYNRGYTPEYQDDTTVFEKPSEGLMIFKSSVGSMATYELGDGMTVNPKSLVFHVEAQDVHHYLLHFSFYTYEIVGGTAEARAPILHTVPVVFKHEDKYASEGEEIEDIEIEDYYVERKSADSITYTSTDYLRSNAVVTKRMLLSTEHTPADYLLSLCKMFGWYFTYDHLAKRVAIKTRNELFDSSITDLTERIDRTKGLTIQPYAIDSKWYDFALESAGGQFADEYEASTGRVYGLMRINTGYQFNSEKKAVLDSVIFRGAVPTLETNRYFNVIMNGTKMIPSVFLDTGTKYTMWSVTGESKDIDISQPQSNLPLTWYNDLHGYDIDGAWKAQLHGDDNQAGEGDGVLLFYNGKKVYNRFKLTDDLPEMNQVNNGVPCWILGYDADAPTLSVPCFAGYKTEEGGTEVTLSTDFGIPKELNIPNIQYTEDKTIYWNAWRAYLADKYNKDTKVLTAYIDFRGLKVDQMLLRRFYYYDNALWIINKIQNYSMTTDDPCKCELVKVQDMDNYIYGQSY